jgi:hypothetical protein
VLLPARFCPLFCPVVHAAGSAFVPFALEYNNADENQKSYKNSNSSKFEKKEKSIGNRYLKIHIF